ncbi:MAG: UDP-glucose 4-epimerase GalE [Bacteroidales bacterium]|nr:UDP-glucose 4-epimerase GalE [Bacteroidales bacterium]
MAQKQTILVTGGTGYIGSHTTVELIEKGYNVVIIDNLSNSDKTVLDGIKKIIGTKPDFYQIDMCEPDAVKKIFEKHKDIKAVIHFAASKAVGESVEKPLKYYENNLISLIYLLKAMSECSINQLVFSSSCTVYGQPEELPVTENAPIQTANSPYGNTKQIAEEIIKDIIVSKAELNAVLLRYFNPIGAHPTAHIGELPNGVPNNLIPFITQTAAGIRKELKIFGDDYETPDGTAIRDYINVVDLAKAHVIAIERLLTSKNDRPLEIFNLGTGKGNSVLEMVKTFERATGISFPYTIVDRREGDIEQVWADTTYANEVLGWKAEIPLEETLISAWTWEKKIRNL